ncbi:MAG: hypothetical protein WCK49_03640 [Myxococcaceae bacterium]
MSSSLIKSIAQFVIPSFLAIAVSWGTQQARLESLEKELLEMRQALGGHEKDEAWEDRFNELLQILNRLESRLGRR